MVLLRYFAQTEFVCGTSAAFSGYSHINLFTSKEAQKYVQPMA